MTAFQQVRSRLVSRLDPDPHRRGRQFERICQWFLTHDPVYRTSFARCGCGMSGLAGGALTPVSTWSPRTMKGTCGRSRPRRTTPPTGSPSTTWTPSCPSRGGREFSFRLLIATTDRIGRTAKRTIEAQEKQASFLVLAGPGSRRGQLARLPVGSACPATAAEADPGIISAKRSTTVVEGFDQSDRGQMIMACGTGKTLTALFINEKLAAQRTLVLVPSLSLLAQTLREWRANQPHRSRLSLPARCT